MSRSMWSSARNHYTRVVEFDGSLSGIGILFILVDMWGVEVPVASASVDITGLNFGSDSSNQNTSEFLGGLLAGRGLKMLGWEKEPVLYRGDSVSALSWIRKEGVKSDNASAAGVAFVLQAVTYGMIGLSQEHLAAELNTNADSRSRGGTVADLGARWAGTRVLDLDADVLLSLCQPGWVLDSDVEFVSFVERVRAEIDRF
jgi:hypothetical protein